MIGRMLSGVRVALGCDFLENREIVRQARQLIYTGPIDELFDCDLGRLEYRSLHFKHTRIEQPTYLGAPTVNYSEFMVPYTREMEWKYFWKADTGHTLITTEYPKEYRPDGREGTEPYYPVETEANRQLYRLYADRLEGLPVIAAGRLGKYRYYNMDQAIGAALVLAEKLLKDNYGS